MTFILSLSRAIDQDVTARVSTKRLNACKAEEAAAEVFAERNDYLKVSGEFTIPAGQTTTVLVGILDDLLHEGDEIFFANVAGATNAIIQRRVGRGTIIDDDDLPCIGILRNTPVNEGKRARVPAFLVPVPSGRAKGVSVDYQTQDATARAGSDCHFADGGLTWDPPGCGEKGKTKQVIRVRTIQDSERERPDEFFRILLSKPENTTLERKDARVTIQDDD